MDALLILGGLLLVVFSMVWLSMQAFSTGLLWGWSTLIPPFNLIYLLAHWKRGKRVLLLTGMGLILLVVGVTMMAQRNPERLSELLSWQWLTPEPEARPELAIELRGQINGHEFRPQFAELLNGLLSLREGGDFFARHEISLHLPKGYTSGPLRMDVLPTDPDPLPLVEISWQSEGSPLPEFWRLSRGYSLHLDMQPVAPNKLQGDFHLILPNEYQTSISGRLELYTDQLRYVDGQLDRGHDSLDTLQAVVLDYLQRRWQRRDIRVVPMLPPSAAQWRDGEVTQTVRYHQGDELAELPLTLKKHSIKGWRVMDDNYAPLPAAPLTPAPVVEVEPAPAPSAANDRRVGFSLPQLLATPERYHGAQMRVVNERGREASGLFAGINEEGQLQIRQVRDDAGEVLFSFSRREIVLLELLEP